MCNRVQDIMDIHSMRKITSNEQRLETINASTMNMLVKLIRDCAYTMRPVQRPMSVYNIT